MIMSLNSGIYPYSSSLDFVCTRLTNSSLLLSRISHLSRSCSSCVPVPKYGPSSGARFSCFSVSSKFAEKQKDSIVPPDTREEAIDQVRSRLSALLSKTLRNLEAQGKQRKLRQLRLRVEIPINDESPSALVSLISQILDGFSVNTRGNSLNIAVFLSDSEIPGLSPEAFGSSLNVVVVSLAQTVDLGCVQDFDVLLFVGPGIDQIAAIEAISKELAPRPVILFNPGWVPEDAEDAEKSSFISSFEVIYSFTPLAIQGFFKKTEGAVFRCVNQGNIGSGRSYPWFLLVKEREEYRSVAEFKKRPGAREIESALYDFVARESPVTKSVKFIRNLISGARDNK